MLINTSQYLSLKNRIHKKYLALNNIMIYLRTVVIKILKIVC